MKRILRVAAALSLLSPGSALAQAHPSGIVNLGTLQNTAVDASSVNGSRTLDNRFYGVANLFDGGQHVIQGINYTSWLTDSAPRHWLKMSFESPMETHSVMIEFNAAAWGTAIPGVSPGLNLPAASTVARRPREFALDLTTIDNGRRLTKRLPSVSVDGFRTFYPLEAPVEHAVEIVIVFPGPSMVEVGELEVLGKASLPVEGVAQGPRLATRPRD